MDVTKTIKYNLSQGLYGKVWSIQELSGDNIAWTIKRNNEFGVIVPAIGLQNDFNESFAHVQIRTERNTVIGERVFDTLLLTCDKPELLNEFVTICNDFVDPGEHGEKRIALVNKPEVWWTHWKNLLGNRVSNSNPYDTFGELCALEYLLKNSVSAKWVGPSGGTHDIQSDSGNFEVKTTSKRYGYEVTIHSVYQMDNIQSLNLIFCRTEEDSSGRCIDDMVDCISNLGYSKLQLEELLDAKGLYKGTHGRKIKYRLNEMIMFAIDDKFPAITFESFKDNKLPNHVIKLSYTVDLSGIHFVNLLC